MVMTTNGGTTWTTLTALDVMMTGGGTFRYTNTIGPDDRYWRGEHAPEWLPSADAGGL